MNEHPIKAIRRAGVPLVAYETSDPAQTIRACVAALGTDKDKTPLVAWDIVRGQKAMNEQGERLLSKLGKEPLTVPDVFLDELLNEALKDKTVAVDALVFLHLGNRWVDNSGFVQALWNLRDALKVIGGAVVLLCPQITLPPELQHDVVIVTDPLPNPAEVGELVDKIVKDAGVPAPKGTDREKCVDTLMGLSAFSAEQALAMSLGKDGVDRKALWERKRKMVEQTPGLSVFRGGETFDSVGGCANVKKFLSKVLKSGRNPVRTVIFVDEIEKTLAGARGDLSGVSQDQLMVFLKEMQDGNIPGLLLIGPPGTGKSVIAKGAAKVADAEMVALDMGAMTGSLVGESQAKIRQAWRVISAISQNKAIVIATCNRIASLPPELRRRFRLGTFFMDMPDKVEREEIWRIHLAKFGFDFGTALRPDDDGWTGAEIEACCDIAWRSESSLIEAAKYIVPVSKSAAEEIDEMRATAHERFISASHDGFYKHEMKPGQERPRKMTVTAVQATMDAPQQQKEEE